MHAWEYSRFSRTTGPVGMIICTCAGVLLLSSFGLAENIDKRWVGPLNATVNVFSAGPFALAYLLAAWGWGRPLAWLAARGSKSRHYLQFAIGVGVLLFISHAMGMFGLLSAGAEGAHAGAARVWGWAAVGVGLVMLVDQVARTSLRPERWPVLPKAALLVAPGAAVLIVAACNAPGALWESEHGAYDVLSYHLQLPKEWAAGIRLWPVVHNVYSYLPSYVESAYLHMATLVPGPTDPLKRMIGGDGMWIIACQLLHAMLAFAAAVLTGRAATVACHACGVNERRAAFLGVLAGALVVSTPWVIVTGSLAYNESGVLIAMAGGLLAALDADMKPWARGGVAGLLAGIACSCKPTSAFLGAPAIGILLLARMPVRGWAGAAATGTIAGCAAIAPWLFRNDHASDNPVFPFAAQQLGMGHWTLEQVARYGRAHSFNGTTLERLSRLFSARYGLAHEQWGLILIILGASVVATLLWRPSRVLAVWLWLGLVVQGVAWALLTHLQSRFLLPIIVPAAVLAALMGAAMLARFGASWLSVGGRSLAGTAAAVVPLATAGWSIVLFMSDGLYRPNRLLALGPAFQTGFVVEDRIRTMTERDANLELKRGLPFPYINTVIRPQETEDAGVYLLGDCAPLYIMGASGLAGTAPGLHSSTATTAHSPVYYHTTWDASPLGRAMLAAPSNPKRWSDALRFMGMRYVLINFDELYRLIRTDMNYDPNVSLQQIMRWIDDREAGLIEIQSWPLPSAGYSTPSGHALFRIDVEPPGAEPMREPAPVTDRPDADPSGEPGEGERP